MPPRYTVHIKDLQKGAKQEQKEHPGASETRARRIARDHIQHYGPGYYRAEPVAERIVQNINHPQEKSTQTVQSINRQSVLLKIICF
jgi:hypothetical protein